VELLVQEADLRGRRVLDVGCGTGKLATALVDRYGCKVWGVDASPEMIEVARRRVPRGVGLKVGRAESLDFKDGWFERVTMTLVLQLVERPRAFAEVFRVLGDGGIFSVTTFDYMHFESYYLNRFFPSFEALDKARFPDRRSLEKELRAAGFSSTRLVRVTQHETLPREAILDRIRGKHISTFQLIDDEEYEQGLASAERELGEQEKHTLEWVVAVARR
jgi:ubiquinone/menaquinone biosynthesis C-methylase UbiE